MCTRILTLATLLVGAIAGTACAGEAAVPSSAVDLGPLYFSWAVPDGEGWTAAGPILEGQEGTNGNRFLAVRPFYSRGRAGESSFSDFLWPVGTIRQRGIDRTWRFLTFYGNNFNTTNTDSRRRWALFPFVFGGRDIAGHRYFAVFPIGGSLHEYLGQDEINFALFPLYASHRVNDVQSYHLLWPLMARADGPGKHRFRVFPLYGRSTIEGQWTKRFVLWPFWTSVDVSPSGREGGGFVLFPLFGHVRTQKVQTLWLVPPLVKFSRVGTGREILAPWPFIQYSSVDQHKFYAWPLWGRRETPYRKSGFFLWPLGHYTQMPRRNEWVSTWMFLPFLYSEKSVPRAAAETSSKAEVEPRPDAVAAADRASDRYFKVWPLMSYRRTGDARQFRSLDLWPLRQTDVIDRNWAPFWTLYSRSRGQGGETRTTVLWGLYRGQSGSNVVNRTSLFPFFSAESSPDGASSSLSALLGLVRTERSGEQRSWRFLYFIGKSGSPQAKAAESAESGR